MKLNSTSIKDASAWEAIGYAMPRYDREEMIRRTRENPRWIHFGAGNIFRAFHAKAQQQLLNEGLADAGIIAAECRGSELAEKVFAPYDDLTLLVEYGEGGSIKKSVIGSIAEVCTAQGADRLTRMREIFRAPTLQIASFTITEKGYKLTDSAGKPLPDVEKDFAGGADAPTSYMGKIAALLYERFISGAYPVAMVSMDNCSDNGEVLRSAVMAFAEKWEENGLINKGFADYLRSDKVSFPMTMIDKITPRPDPSVEELLKKDGIENIGCVKTSKNTYAAAYVNAEELGYLVIEDKFPNGRPPFEKCGFYMTDKETVRLTEKMKVTTCLNPLHTALAVFGCLLGYERICDEAADPLLLELVKRIGFGEGLPVVVKQELIDPKKFIDEVINVRLPNPHLPDTPQRIACDTSMKVPIRFGETVKQYVSRGEADKLTYIPLVIAGWLRYLMAANDRGERFELSSDPFLADERAKYMSGLEIGGEYSAERIKSILSDSGIFGLDLCAAGLGDRIIGFFDELRSTAGAVESTLRKYLK